MLHPEGEALGSIGCANVCQYLQTSCDDEYDANLNVEVRRVLLPQPLFVVIVCEWQPQGQRCCGPSVQVSVCC